MEEDWLGISLDLACTQLSASSGGGTLCTEMPRTSAVAVVSVSLSQVLVDNTDHPSTLSQCSIPFRSLVLTLWNFRWQSRTTAMPSYFRISSSFSSTWPDRRPPSLLILLPRKYSNSLGSQMLCFPMEERIYWLMLCRIYASSSGSLNSTPHSTTHSVIHKYSLLHVSLPQSAALCIRSACLQ